MKMQVYGGLRTINVCLDTNQYFKLRDITSLPQFVLASLISPSPLQLTPLPQGP